MPNPATSEAYVARHLEESARLALTDTRIVAIVGPRQSGKTTLVKKLCEDSKREYVSLDDEQIRRNAVEDPIGFVRRLPYAAIDEIQRAPNLILAMKMSVDENPRPGRYLITGSVDLFKGAISPDSLAGRVETIPLLPFSQAEIGGIPAARFLERAFQGDFPSVRAMTPTSDLIERVIAGGFPLALSRKTENRRRSWLRFYAQSLADRDASDSIRIGKHDQLARLIEFAALSSGQLTNLAKIGACISVDGKTVDRWLDLLESLFLIRRIQPWHSNQMKRMIKTPKLQFIDSGLLAALQQIGRAGIERDRGKLGPLLESFVYGEIAKACALFDEITHVSHYRDKDGVEVDFVIESLSGLAVGIEVKAGATVHPKDFRGLKRIGESLAGRFACGIVLHDGQRIQQFDSKLFAMPFRMLWEA